MKNKHTAKGSLQSESAHGRFAKTLLILSFVVVGLALTAFSDATSARVSLVSPESGVTVSGVQPVIVQDRRGEETGVTAEFFANGQPIAVSDECVFITLIQPGRHESCWDTRTVANGKYKIQARLNYPGGKSMMSVPTWVTVINTPVSADAEPGMPSSGTR